MNGTLDAEPEAVASLSQAAEQWQLGGPSNNGFGTPTLPNYQGRLDDFSVWSHALNAAQAEALSQATAVDQIEGLADVYEIDLAEAVSEAAQGVWIRQRFDAEALFYDSLELSVRYDDGFVAYLNGLLSLRGTHRLTCNGILVPREFESEPTCCWLNR